MHSVLFFRTAIAAIEASTPDDAVCDSNHPLDILRDIDRKLDGFRNDDGCGLPNEDAYVDKVCLLSDESSDCNKVALQDDDEETDDVLQITSRQEDVNRQMEKLLQQIKDKEQLIVQTIANADSFEKMRHKYEVSKIRP